MFFLWKILLAVLLVISFKFIWNTWSSCHYYYLHNWPSENSFSVVLFPTYRKLLSLLSDCSFLNNFTVFIEIKSKRKIIHYSPKFFLPMWRSHILSTLFIVLSLSLKAVILVVNKPNEAKFQKVIKIQKPVNTY